MPETKNENITVLSLEFEDVKKPTYSVDRKSGMVKYGENNDYPNYLLSMFDGCGKHSSIVQGKAEFIIGNGFAFVEENATQNEKAKVLIDRANADGDTLAEVSQRVALDVETFGQGYFLIMYNRNKKVSEIYQAEFVNVRTNNQLSKFWYAEDFIIEDEQGLLTENNKPTIEEIKPFDLSKPGGKQILCVREYRPNSKAYTKPNYFAALRSIQTDICISEYHLNGITNGAFSSKLINFNNGTPDETEQKELEKKVNKKFAGAKNAGKIMISFNKSKENEPTVTDISATELDKQFDILEKNVEKQIFSSHRVTSPGLFGIKTDSAFSKEDLRPAFELFQNTYINSKRKIFEKAINVILKVNNIPSIYLQRSEPISAPVSEASANEVMTEDEKRERLGLKPKQQEAAEKGNKAIVKTINSLSPLVANKVISSMTSNEVRAIAGLPPIAGGDVIPDTTAAPAKFSSDLDDDKDILVFSEFGSDKNDFEIVDSRRVLFENDFDFYKAYFADVATLDAVQQSVLNLLAKDAKLTPEAIAESLKISATSVKGILKALQDGKYIDVSTTGSGIDSEALRTPTSKAAKILEKIETTSISLAYSYEGARDAKNRPFCAKLLDLNRLYSREDIEKMSARLGYSVWHRRGGWYRPKGATEALPFCRHYWQVNTIIKKTKK